MSAGPSLNVRRKRKYIITNEAVPRRTRYRRKKVSEALGNSRPNQQRVKLSSEEDGEGGSSESSDTDFAETFPLQRMNTNASSNIVCSYQVSDVEDETECQTPLLSDQWRNGPDIYDNDFFTTPNRDGSLSDIDNSIADDVSEEINSDTSAVSSTPSSPTLSGISSQFSDSCERDGAHDTVDDNVNLTVNQLSEPACSVNKTQVLLSNTLCKCSPTTEGDVLLMVLTLGIRHHLTWVAMVDILKMVNTIYGYDAVHATKYYLQKFCEIGENSIRYHIYCPKCEAYIGERQEIDNRDVLSCECGEKVPNFDRNTSHFLSVDMEKQFKQLLELPEVAKEILTYRFQRKKMNANAYEDIYDGSVYKNLSAPGCVLSNPLNFSYTFTTDGVSLGKSTGSSVWPIWAFCNELSPKLRRKHMLFAGVWVGSKEPNMRLFLNPFVDLANRLSTQGVEWTDQTGKQQVSKIIALCCVCDSAARYKLLNMSSYTAYYGCTFCYHRAENTTKGRRFTVTTEEVPLRTQESMLRDMSDAFRNRNDKDPRKRVVLGQKGPTPLIKMLHVSLNEAFVVDFMHSVLLGNVRSHLFIFLERFGQTDYYIGSPDSKFIIDQRLLSIKPPKSFTRNPRALKDVKYWKASEWRSFILYYSLVCLGGVVERKYLNHLALLSNAMYIFLKKSITTAETQTAENNLLRYVFYMENYFGKTAMLYNVHLLLHITKGVYNFGPLWTHNAFDFESNNHRLVQMHTSPGFVAQQLAKRYLIFNSLPTLCEKYASTDHPLDFIKEVTGKG